MSRSKPTPLPASTMAQLGAAPVDTPAVRTVPPVNIRVITEGLRFPEGPVVMDDGSVIVVEMERETLSRCYMDGTVEVVADVPGGPNGAAIGPDGACYVANNGGFEWVKTPMGLMMPASPKNGYTGGSIDRVDLKTGQVTTLYDSAGGNRLSAPNDLMFDRNGGFWFTDFGKTVGRHTDRGSLCYGRADGSFVTEAVFPMIGPNGCGVSPDGKRVYVAEFPTGRLYGFDITGEGTVEKQGGFLPGHLIAAPGGNTFWDSLAIEADGSVVIACPQRGGLMRITPDGKTIEHTPLNDFLTTNLAFGGPDMKTAYVTLTAAGRLIAIDWPRPGLKLPYTA